jgi:hypothetical protein
VIMSRHEVVPRENFLLDISMEGISQFHVHHNLHTLCHCTSFLELHEESHVPDNATLHTQVKQAINTLECTKPLSTALMCHALYERDISKCTNMKLQK